MKGSTPSIEIQHETVVCKQQEDFPKLTSSIKRTVAFLLYSSCTDYYIQDAQLSQIAKI